MMMMKDTKILVSERVNRSGIGEKVEVRKNSIFPFMDFFKR